MLLRLLDTLFSGVAARCDAARGVSRRDIAQAPARARARACLDYFYPRLSAGGVILCDDYGAPLFPGAARAWDAFCEENDVPFVVLDTGQSVILKVRGERRETESVRGTSRNTRLQLTAHRR